MVLITGITGLTGRFLYQEIKKSAIKPEIKYLVRFSSDTSFMDERDQKYNLVFGDIKDVSSWENVLDTVSSVIHIAYIMNSEIITQACLNHGMKRVFYVNTTGMYSKHKSYANMYIDWEKKIKASGITYTIIRPTMIYGNHRDVNIHKLIKIMNKYPVFPIIGQGRGLMHPIYAGDLARVIWVAYLNEEKTRYKEYNVAGKHALSYKNLLESIRTALDKRVKFVHIPYAIALLIGKIGDIFPNGLIDYEKVQRLEEDKSFDYSLARDELDFAPISFEEGVKLEVESLRKDGII